MMWSRYTHHIRCSSLLLLLLVLLSASSPPASVQAAPQAGSPPVAASASASTSTSAPICIWRDLCPRVDGSSINLARCSRPPAPSPQAASASSGSASSPSGAPASCAAPDSWRSAIARQQVPSSGGRRSVAVFKSVHAQRLDLSTLPLGLCGLEAITDELFLNENLLRAFPDTSSATYSYSYAFGASASGSASSSASSQQSDLVAREQRECLRRLDPVVLKLYDNQLVAIDMDFVLSLPRLEELDLSRNLLETLPPVHVTLELIERSALRRVILKENRLKVVDTSLLQIVALEFLDLSANRIARVLNSTRWALDRTAIEEKRYARLINMSPGSNNNNNQNQNSIQAAAILGPQAQTSGSRTGSGSINGQNGQSQSQSQIGLPAASASASATYSEKVTVLVYGNDFTGAFDRAAWPLVPQLTQITDLKVTILAVSRFIKLYEALVNLDVRESRVTCDCLLLETRKYLKSVQREAADGREGPKEQKFLRRLLEDMRCNADSGKTLEARALASLEEAELRCPLLDRCPTSCSCTHTPAILEVRLDCTLMPGSVPTALNHMRPGVGGNGGWSGAGANGFAGVGSPTAVGQGGQPNQQGLPPEIALLNHRIVLNLTAAETLVPIGGSESSGAVLAVLTQTSVFDARRARLTRLVESLSVVAAARRAYGSRLTSVQLAGNPFRCTCSHSDLSALRQLRISAGVDDFAALDCVFPDRPDVRVHVVNELPTICATTATSTTATMTTTTTTLPPPPLPPTLPLATTAPTTTATSPTTTALERVDQLIVRTEAPTETESDTVAPTGGGSGVMLVVLIACALLLVLIFLSITLCILYYLYQRDKLRHRNCREHSNRPQNMNRIYNPIGAGVPVNGSTVFALNPLTSNRESNAFSSSLSLPDDSRPASRRQSTGFRERQSRQQQRLPGTFLHHSRPGSDEDSPDSHSPDRLRLHRGLLDQQQNRDRGLQMNRDREPHYANEHSYANTVELLSSPNARSRPNFNNSNSSSSNNANNANNANNVNGNGNCVGVAAQYRPSGETRENDENALLGGCMSNASTPTSSFASSMSPTTGHDRTTAPVQRGSIFNLLQRGLTHLEPRPHSHSHSHSAHQPPPASVNANDEFGFTLEPSRTSGTPPTTTTTTATTTSCSAMNNGEPDSELETILPSQSPTIQRAQPHHQQPQPTPTSTASASVSVPFAAPTHRSSTAAAVQLQTQLHSPSLESTRSQPLCRESRPQQQHYHPNPNPRRNPNPQAQSQSQVQSPNRSLCARDNQSASQQLLRSAHTPQSVRSGVSVVERAGRTRSRGDLLLEHDRSSDSTHSCTRQQLQEEISFV